MLVNDIEIFLKKTEAKSVNMFVNDIEIFKGKLSIKKIILKCKK